MDYKKAGINLGLLILILGGGSLILPKLLLALMPFILGWFLALILNPPICFVEKKLKIKRKAGSALVITFVIILIFTCLYFLVRILSQKTEELFMFLPSFLENTREEMTTLLVHWRRLTDDFPPGFRNKTEEIVKIMGRQMKEEVEKIGFLQIISVENTTQKLPGKLFSFLLFLLSTCYFAVEKEKIEKTMAQRLPREWKDKFNIIKKTMADILGTYLKVQLKIELRIYLLLVVGFFILKTGYGFLIAIPIAILDLFPVFGTGVILVPWMIFCLLKGNLVRALGLGILWVGTLLVRQLIQPKLIGKSMGIGTISSLVLLYLGYRWAKIAGMFFAVPLGILVLGMNEAGFFENCKLSIKTLWMGLEKLRSFSEVKEEEVKRRDEKELQSSDSV